MTYRDALGSLSTLAYEVGIHRLIVIILFICFYSLCKANVIFPPQDQVLRSSVFAEDPRRLGTNNDSFHSVGLISGNIAGIGPVYKYYFNDKYSMTMAVTYRSSDKVYFDNGGLSFGSIDIHDRFQMLIAVDRVFHIGNYRYWGLVFGLGIGYKNFYAKGQLPKKNCTSFYCGYEPAVEISQHHSAGFLLGRAGFVLLDKVVWGVTGDLAALVLMDFSRAERTQIFAKDGTSIQPMSFTSFLLELTIRL